MNVFVMLCGSIVVTYINLDYVMRKKKNALILVTPQTVLSAVD